MKIILDNGHGYDTAGKRSPIWSDGKQLLEWEFNRDVVKRIAQKLQAKGIVPVILVPEEIDISLSQRVARVNKIAKDNAGNAILISVHGNAGGGTGWECFTSVGKTKSDVYASIMCDEFKREFPNKRMRFDMSDGDPDKESDFYILKKTTCPAILTENFFMDTEADCRLMMEFDGRERIANAHVSAILKMI